MRKLGSPSDPKEREFEGIRRIDRVRIHIPLTLKGKDKQGHAFEERGRTVVVRRHGASFETKRFLEMENVVTVETPTGQHLRVNVVRNGGPSAEGAGSITIECTGFAQALGLYFPPDT